jgi:hypothetical protein
VAVPQPAVTNPARASAVVQFTKDFFIGLLLFSRSERMPSESLDDRSICPASCSVK